MLQRLLAHRLFGEPLVRVVLAVTWAWQGVLIVARPPIEVPLLAQYLGQEVSMTMIALAVATNLVIAVLLLTAPQTRSLAFIQVVAVLVSTITVTVISPDLWWDAYGALPKNAAFIVAVLAWDDLRKRKRVMPPASSSHA